MKAEQLLTLSKLSTPEQNTKTPFHVAIVMDGNGRWALQRNRPRLVGHHMGAERVREIVRVCPALGITHLTIFAFSTENWQRNKDEVSGLMALCCNYIETETESLLQSGVKVRFIGERKQINAHLCRLIGNLEKTTENNVEFHLTIAINYGGRNELCRATKKIAHDIANGFLTPDSITENTVAAYLDTHALPDPDLVIRTSGEKRISNFLLWQTAYSEYVFTKTLWPDFTKSHFIKILDSYKKRDRRFGAINTSTVPYDDTPKQNSTYLQDNRR